MKDLAGGIVFTLPILIGIAVAIVMVIAMWIVFAKAGQPGWASIIPFYNYYVLLKIAGKPGWWLWLLFIPVVNLVMMIKALAGLARHFGKENAGFVAGLFFLPFIFYPILAFGDAQYLGRAD